MIIRVKDLWMVRTGIERMLASKDLSITNSVDPLWTALRIYQEQRKQVWDRLGLNKPFRWWSWYRKWNHRKLVGKFNDEVAVLAEEEVSFAPIPAERFPGTVQEFIALRDKGIVSG